MIKKILLVLGIISFSLIGFTNGYYTAYIDTDNDISTNYPNSTFSPDADGNFNMTVDGETKNVFYLNSAGGSRYVYRTMYFYYDEDNLNFWAKQRGYYYTGLVNKFRISTASDIPNLNRFDWFNGTGTREDVKNSGIGGHISSILYYPQSSSADTPGGNFCFVSNDLDLSVCVSCYQGNNFAGCSTDYAGGELITDDNSFYFNNLDNSLLKLSALVDNSGGGFIPENGFPNTNRGVFDSYAEEGYVLKFCYSDFALDDLATSTGGIYQFYETDLDDGVYYTGASVLDLFIEYGYGNSFESFFDYWYNTYSQSLKTDSPVKYVGLSKGLWNMSNKYYYAGLSNKYVDYTKFYNYCSYFVNFDGDWDGEYTGPELPSDVSNNLSQSSSAIEYLSGFIHNQLSSGNNQNFDADSFFNTLTIKFDRLLNNINGSFIGIIPGYILAIMMALIFIRIISH